MKKKNGFTLAETIIVCSVFAFILVGIIFGINRALIFLNNTRLQVMATNFAREGVEMVYNIRDTNRKRYPGDKDLHWANHGTGDSNFGSGIYIIKEGITGSNNDSYIYAEYLTGNQNFYEMDGFFDSSDKSKTELIFTGSYSYNSGGSIVTGSLDELMDGFGTRFYRIVRVYGVYNKNANDSSVSIGGNNLIDGTPAELRFCVKVFYEGSTGKHAKELCSIMTNFAK